MFKAIFSALKVKPDEYEQVYLLLFQGFFLGSFLATYQVSAETLFLNQMPEYLEEAFVVSGVLGVITTVVFSTAQGRITFKRLSVLNYLIIASITTVLYIGYFFMPEQYKFVIVFMMFAMLGPFTAVILLGFWGVFGRLFDLRQSKRIIGWIDSGQLIAAILTFFLIPLFEGVIGDSGNLLIASVVSVLLSAVFLIILISKFDLKQGHAEKQTKEVREETRLSKLLKDNYVRILSGFLLFSMMCFIIIQYTFQDALSSQYPNEEELRNFISFFEAFILIFMLILQAFVNDRILSEYGIKVALFLLPIVILFFTLITIFVGHFFGYDSGTDTFIYFFLAITLTRLFSKSLRDALENPTFKLYFMPLDNRFRFNIQTKIEGIINESSRLVGAVFIIILSLLSFVEIIHISYILAALTFGYLYLIGKMYEEYRNKIRIKLQTQGDNEILESNEVKVIGRLQNSIFINNSHKVIFSFKLLEKINPSIVADNINKIMNHETEEVRTYAQQRMNEIKGLSVSEKYIINYDPSNTGYKGRYIVKGRDLEELLKLGDISQRRILKLSRSYSPEDRLYAAELIINSTNNESISILIELLSDSNFNVRITAIKAAQQKYNQEVLFAVIKNLEQPTYSNQAADTLVVIGEKALPTLDSAFYKSGQSTMILIKIVQIMGKIGGAKSKSLLWNKIDYPDKIVASQVLIALGQSGFKAGISQITHIKYAIESDIEDIAWNLAALNEVDDIDFGYEIVNALKEENDHDIAHIYMLLGMLYDNQSIELVKDNIESGTSEGVSFAVELLDVFLSDDLKQRIIPVIDDLTDGEKSRKLENYYPRQRLKSNETLKHLLNREFNQTNHWTKACVIYQIGILKLDQYLFDLIASLFNPDPLIHEIAAWAIHNINPQLYEEHSVRLDQDLKEKLDVMVAHQRNNLMKFNKIRFMKKCPMFKNVHGLVLSELADMAEDVPIRSGKSILVTENNNYNFYLVYEGELEIYENMELRNVVGTGDFIGEVFSTRGRMGNSFVKAKTNSLLLKFYKDTFYDYLADHVNLADRVVESV